MYVNKENLIITLNSQPDQKLLDKGPDPKPAPRYCEDFQWAVKQAPKSTTDSIVWQFDTSIDLFRSHAFNTKKLKERIEHVSELYEVFESLTSLTDHNIQEKVLNIRNKLFNTYIFNFCVYVAGFVGITYAMFLSSLYSLLYLVLIGLCVSSIRNYILTLREKTRKFFEKREKHLAEKLNFWNEMKFRESYQLEWSVGLLGSYIELACIEGRPVENINFCFPPRKSLVKAEALIFDIEDDVCSGKIVTEVAEKETDCRVITGQTRVTESSSSKDSFEVESV
jgi:hypothetical protein